MKDTQTLENGSHTDHADPYHTGTTFKKAPRQPLDEVPHINHW
jgi:hypothetical protein